MIKGVGDDHTWRGPDCFRCRWNEGKEGWVIESGGCHQSFGPFRNDDDCQSLLLFERKICVSCIEVVLG